MSAVKGLGCSVEDSGFGIRGFGVSGLGFRVWGLAFGVELRA